MRKSLSFLFLLSLLAACTSPSRELSPPGNPPSPTGFARNPYPWAGALRALDPADATSPAHDLTAVYLRQVEGRLQIRVDLLDFQKSGDLSLDVKIGDESTPGAVPFHIPIPSEADSARVSLDPLLDTVTIDVPTAELPSRPLIDISSPEDQITGLRLDGPVPAPSAPLLLTFYDSFAARFPAEALRSWDGAHTGPRGGRHGLKHLLEAAEKYQVPLVLLDLKEPENVSALDAMGMLPQIQHMEQNGLLILPDVIEQDALFGFSPSLFSWREKLTHATHVFTPITDISHIYHPLFSKTTYIPIVTASDSTQASAEGPSLEVRRALLEGALNEDETDLLVLGGSLRETTWGSPEMAGATLAYFASRPYIHILGEEELIAFPARRGKPEFGFLPHDKALYDLQTHCRTLTKPVLEFAANWQGSSLSSCNSDLDKDGLPECVLANDTYLAILDPQGARLTYLFAVARDTISRDVQQLVGPSWQVAAGLSNPALWDLSAGEAADPGAYPGAFADADGPFQPYEAVLAENTLVFTSLDRKRIKTFTLTDTGMDVAYQTQEPVITHIPLLVEPDIRFTPGWAERYVQKKTPGEISWGLENGSMVRIQVEGLALRQAQGGMMLRSFNESLSLLAGPEDPDFDYPPGHYIPFPMALVEAEVQDGYFFRLERLP